MSSSGSKYLFLTPKPRIITTSQNKESTEETNTSGTTIQRLPLITFFEVFLSIPYSNRQF